MFAFYWQYLLRHSDFHGNCFPIAPHPILASLAPTRAQRAEMAGELLQRRIYFDLNGERLEA